MAYDKKRSKDSSAGIVIVLFIVALVQFVFFGLVALVCHNNLMNRYFRNSGPDAMRINDISAVKKPFLAIMLGPTIVFLIYMQICNIAIADGKPWTDAAAILLLASPLLLIWIWLGFVFFQWLAVKHFGVIVDPGKDRIVFQFDQESYDLMDYLQLKFIRDLPRMDEVRLSDIGRITRKSGWDLYLLGSFGSRRITFTNKQKRDECIYAIQNSGRTAAKVPIEFGI